MSPTPPENRFSADTDTDTDADALTQLNAIVLSLEWEITDATMDRLLAEVDRLKPVFQEDASLYPFLQLHRSVGRYIRKKKVAAHPDAVRLLLSVHEGLMRIAGAPGMAPDRKREILIGEVRKFRKLRSDLLRSRPAVPASADDPREPLAAIVAEIGEYVRGELGALREELRALRTEVERKP